MYIVCAAYMYIKAVFHYTSLFSISTVQACTDNCSMQYHQCSIQVLLQNGHKQSKQKGFTKLVSLLRFLQFSTGTDIFGKS